MNKSEVFDSLKNGMQAAGFSEKEQELHLQHYTEKFVGWTDEEIWAEVAGRGGVDAFVQSVVDNRQKILLADEAYRLAAGLLPDEESDAAAEETAAPADDTALTETTETECAAQEPDSTGISADSDDESAEFEPQPADTLPPDEPIAQEDPIAAQEGESEPAAVASNDMDDMQDGAADAADTVAALFGDEPEEAAAEEPPDEEEADVQTTPEQSKPEQSADPSAFDADADVSAQTRQISVSDLQDMPLESDLHPYFSEQETIAFSDDEDSFQPLEQEHLSVLRQKTYQGEPTPEQKRNFIIGAALISPFSLIIFLLFMLAVGAVWLASVALVPLILGVMLAICVCGVALSLIGLIYGLSQVFVVKAVGLFEIGIGVSVLGVTLLVCILLYNLAVRVVPKLIGKTWQLVRLTFRFLVDLFCYIRGECYRH